MTEIITLKPNTKMLGSMIQRYISALGEDDIEIGDGYAVVRATADHPCDLAGRAYIQIARLVMSKGYQFSVTHRIGCCKKHGDPCCIYDIQWWEETPESITK